MIGPKVFAVMVVLAATVGAVAGTALGVSLAVWTDRMRSALGEVYWDGVDE